MPNGSGTLVWPIPSPSPVDEGKVCTRLAQRLFKRANLLLKPLDVPTMRRAE